MENPILWRRAAVIAIVIAVVIAGVIWYAPLSRLRFSLSNPQVSPAVIAIFVDTVPPQPGEEHIIVELESMETAVKACQVTAGTHWLSFAWGFQEDSSAFEYSHATRPICIVLSHFETEEIALSVF